MKTISLGLLLSFSALASTHQGVATWEGRVIYTEKHSITQTSGTIQKAETEYVTKDGKLIATLKSDFSKSVALADHEFYDARFERRYGVRWVQDQAWMWDQKKGEAEEKKLVTKDLAPGKLIIGGQGLHYYMSPRLEEFKRKETAIAILIPGKLDWYSFLVTYEGVDQGWDKFVIKTQSAILRLFAPKLEVWYSGDGKLRKYRGLSNLPDAEGGNQQVEIIYQY